MDPTNAQPANLARSLEDVLRTPLDRISAERAADVVRDILERESHRISVDVARFSSAI